MPYPIKIIPAAVAVVLVSSASVALSAGAAVAAPGRSAGSSSATAAFSKHLIGESRFVQKGSSVSVTGHYAGLTPGNSYFTVVYANTNCDPAQAFPVGYFTAGLLGTARLRMTVAAPSTTLVAGTRSMSVRMADTAADLDGDGKTGPTDVVAVAGTPSIGLIECNSHPLVTSS